MTESKISNLQTPSLLLDKARLEQNCLRMKSRMASMGVGLRPHMKTSKCIEVARLASPNGAITVSTLKEAEYFSAAGYTDILYAVGITPDKINRAADLQHNDADLIIVTDHLDAVDRINEAARNSSASFRVLVEIDTGDSRAGIDPEGDELSALASAITQSGNLVFAGIFTHAGQSYEMRQLDDVRKVAELERSSIVKAAEKLKQLGMPCKIVAPGSTPTAALAANLDGITEMRPGVYVFGDLHQAALGSCQETDIALSVLTQVIGHNRKNGTVLIDAGGLALSKDLSASNHGEPVGYGKVADIHGEFLTPGLHVSKVSQEHGQISSVLSAGIDFSRFEIGHRLRIFPNHACMTAAAYDHYEVIENDQVIAQWDRVNGW
ncbi:MAG: D-serine deaminase-like pyridoxal phosphate-dependent protein [Gammaproteobacteria bacterium]|jgi:D-serine deaminase-like pyridoxal phosphate-dependent protein